VPKDPDFVEKVRNIAGLHLNSPDHALVLCVAKKSQIQARERTQPVLSMERGQDLACSRTALAAQGIPGLPALYR
jgi:hypothetical protein